MPVTAKPESVGLSRRRLALVRPWMERYLDAGKLPCALVLVARHGEIVFLETAGHRDVEAHKNLTEDTIFRIYSMTKPITSVAAMMLYEEGRFQLDDPVARYLPCFADMEVYVSGEGEAMRAEPAREPVTIHHLLTHTSGLTYSFNETPVAALYKERGVQFAVGDGSLTETVRQRQAGRVARRHLERRPRPGRRRHWRVRLRQEHAGTGYRRASPAALERGAAQGPTTAASGEEPRKD